MKRIGYGTKKMLFEKQGKEWVGGETVDKKLLE